MEVDDNTYDPYDSNNTFYNWNVSYEAYNAHDGIEIAERPFSPKSTIAVCGIVTNLALLVILLVRLVKDIREHKADVRWAKRHVLIMMSAAHVIFLPLKIILREDRTEPWTESLSECRVIRTIWMTFEALNPFYGALLAFITLIQIFGPTFLVGLKQNKLWILINVLIWSFLLLFHGILAATSFELKATYIGAKNACIFTGHAEFFVWYIFAFEVAPIVMLFSSAVIAGVGYVLKSSQRLPNAGNDKMLDWIIKTQSQAVLFLIIFAVFTCVTLLPQPALQLEMYFNPEYHYDHRQMTKWEAVSLLRFMYPLLFPVCCLVLDETWLCSAIDKRVFKRGNRASNITVETIDLENQDVQ